MHIERLWPSDAASMQKIEASVVSWPWSLQQYEDAFSAGYLMWGCFENPANHTELQAFALFQQVLDECTLMNLVVHTGCQRQGFAYNLLQKTLRMLKNEYAINRCLLEVRESNIAAIRLYQKMGFEIDGLRKNYYPASTGRETAVLMSCNLQSCLS
jgi:ribosomal-protein-alanine N-acetyltransferase